MPPLIPVDLVGLTRALNMQLELHANGDTAKFGVTGNVSRLRTLPGGHTAVSIVEFSPSGWSLPGHAPAPTGPDERASADRDYTEPTGPAVRSRGLS